MESFRLTHPLSGLIATVLLVCAPPGAAAGDDTEADREKRPRRSGDASTETATTTSADSADDASDGTEDASEESDDETAESNGEKPPEVETTARAPMEKFVTPRATNVVDREEIETKQAQSVTDALDEEPGIFIQSTNRGAGSLFLRGQVGPKNVIYIDGVRFNQSTFRTGPNQYLNTFDPWSVGKLEVVRGPGSVLYGSGAMGGVIQAFPRSMSDKDLQFQGISFYESADNTYGGAVNGSVDTGAFSFHGGATVRNHDQLRVGQQGGASLVATGERNGRVPGSSYEETYYRGGAGVELSDRSLVRFNYFGGVIEDAPRVDRLGGGEIRLYDNRDDLMYATYEYDGPSGIDELTVNASYHRTVERVDRYNCETSAYQGNDSIRVTDQPRACAEQRRDLLAKHRVNEDTVHTVGSSLSGVSRLFDRKLRISWGYDVYHDTVSQSSRRDAEAPTFDFEPRDRGNFSEGSHYTEGGLYAHGEYRFARVDKSDFVATLGGRLAHFNAVAPDVSDELGDVSYNFTGVVGSAAVKYLLGTRVNAHLTWNQGFRAPNLQESTVLGNTGNFFEIPNADLGPERSNTLELGTKLDFPELGKLSASAWVSLIGDKITREKATRNGQDEIDGAPVRRRINADTAYYSGADLSLETTDIEGFKAFGNVSVIDGAVETEDQQAEFQPGPLHDVLSDPDNTYANPRRLPPLTYKLGVELSTDDSWYARLYAQGAGSQTKLGPGDIADERICETAPGVLYDDLGESCPGTPGWTTLNVRGGWAPEDFVQFDLAVENLTDLRYKYHGSGPLAPGINGKLLVSFNTP